jgi:hypothetical protein
MTRAWMPRRVRSAFVVSARVRVSRGSAVHISSGALKTGAPDLFERAITLPRESTWAFAEHLGSIIAAEASLDQESSRGTFRGARKRGSKGPEVVQQSRTRKRNGCSRCRTCRSRVGSGGRQQCHHRHSRMWRGRAVHSRCNHSRVRTACRHCPGRRRRTVRRLRTTHSYRCTFPAPMVAVVVLMVAVMAVAEVAVLAVMAVMVVAVMVMVVAVVATAGANRRTQCETRAAFGRSAWAAEQPFGVRVRRTPGSSSGRVDAPD